MLGVRFLFICLLFQYDWYIRTKHDTNKSVCQMKQTF